MSEEKKRPLVTAIIPTHNHGRWVMDAIMSVANQDYDNLHIIVIDDGSQDRTKDVILNNLYKPRFPPEQGEPWVCMGHLKNSKHPREIMYQQLSEPHGPAFARNFGMKCGWEDTELFAFLDADDIYEPGKIDKSVRVFEKHPNHIAVVYSDNDTIRENGLKQREYREPFDRERLLQDCMVNCDSLVSKQAIEKVGGFDESLRVCEDYDLWIRITEVFAIEHIAESLVTIRVGEHGSTHTINKEVWEQCRRRIGQKLMERQNASQQT